ncbi:MAG: hypothetical protein ACRDL7_09110, partial [Gaiellaceae bacterium]
IVQGGNEGALFVSERRLDRLSWLPWISFYGREQYDCIAKNIAPAEIKVLNLRSIKLETTEMKEIVRALPAFKQLQELSLDNSNIGDSGAEALATVLFNLEKLRNLYLDGNNIGDEGAKLLAHALPWQLQKFHLEKNNVGDAGAGAIATVLPSLTLLQELCLGGNKIGEAGTEALAKALLSTKLTTGHFVFPLSGQEVEAILVINLLRMGCSCEGKGLAYTQESGGDWYILGQQLAECCQDQGLLGRVSRKQPVVVYVSDATTRLVTHKECLYQAHMLMPALYPTPDDLSATQIDKLRKRCSICCDVSLWAINLTTDPDSLSVEAIKSIAPQVRNVETLITVLNVMANAVASKYLLLDDALKEQIEGLFYQVALQNHDIPQEINQLRDLYMFLQENLEFSDSFKSQFPLH